MGRFIGHRLLLMVPTLVLISVVSFVIIQLPPGDDLTTYAANLEASGDLVDAATLEALKAQYGLDDPFHVQYLKWISGFPRGDFGHSFEQRRPVGELLRRPTPAADRRDLAVDVAVHVGGGHSRGHLLGYRPVFAERLHGHVPGVRRPGNAQLPCWR